MTEFSFYVRLSVLKMSLERSSHESPLSDHEKRSDVVHNDNPSSRPKGVGKRTTSHDPNWDGTDVDFSHVDEKAVLRKMDLHLLPMLALLYLLSFLDRGNIGNAKIEGLVETLDMSGPEYNWCLTVFFFTYCAFEVPSNLMYVTPFPQPYFEC